MPLYNPSIRVNDFSRLVIDDTTYIVEGRASSDQINLRREGNEYSSKMHIDDIAKKVHRADRVVLE